MAQESWRLFVFRRFCFVLLVAVELTNLTTDLVVKSAYGDL